MSTTNPITCLPPMTIAPGICHHLRLSLVLLLVVAVRVRGVEELSSNGIGGGRWSDPRSWHGGVVPTENHRVVISGADTIHFDGGVQETPHCAGLSIDPRGVLTFRMDGQPHHLLVKGSVTSFGTIRVDATRDPESQVALMLVAENAKDRVVQLLRGSALLLYGANPETDGQTLNIALTSIIGSDFTGGRILADGDAMIDVQRVRLSAMQIQASRLDNTGYKSNQRLNLIMNHFENGSGVSLTLCDTAVIKDNRFSYGERPVSDLAAIALAQCSLTVCRGNQIEKYNRGIDLTQEIDVSVLNNRIRACQTGLLSRQGRNSMIKGNSVSNTVAAILLDSTSGIVEDLRVAGAKTGVDVRNSAMQFTDLIFTNLAPEAVPLLLRGSAVTLLNCNVSARDIRLEGKPPAAGFWVQCMNYLVVRLTGKVPPRAVVQVATAAVSGGVPKGGAADLNVRNSPASSGPLGWSPLPNTMRPLIVRSWTILANEEVRDPPFYDLQVMGFNPDDTPNPKPLHARVIEPRDSWFRVDPNAPVATLEVKLP